MKTNLKVIQILHDELTANGFKLERRDFGLIYFKNEREVGVFFDEAIIDFNHHKPTAFINYNSRQSINRILKTAGCKRVETCD